LYAAPIDADAEDLVWARAPAFCAAGMELFQGGSAAGDVVQGDLGDCWLLSAMSVVATRPSLMEDKVFLREYNKDAGLLSVSLYKAGGMMFRLSSASAPPQLRLSSS
jgi:hypothetical protein